MKKQSNNTTVIRINLENGGFTTVSRAILENPKLTDSAKTLLQLSLNNAEDWELRVGYYKKLLDWSNDKMAGAVTNLIDNGYMTRKKNPKGKGKGFHYTYVISEYGNLDPEKKTINKDEILKDIVNEEPIEETTTVENDTISKEELWDKLGGIFGEVIWAKAYDPNFVQNVITHYRTQLDSGSLNHSNFNEENIKVLLEKRLAKSNVEVLNQIEKWIDLHNNRGTISQKANIKAQALMNMKERLDNGQPVNEGEVKLKLLYLKSSIVDAGRIIDQRYND